MPSMVKRSLTILLILFGSISLANARSSAAQQSASNAGATGWTWLQDSPVIFCGQGGSKQSCTIGSQQITPTLAGSVWVVQVMTPNNVTISSITGGGGTWIKCPNCHIFNPASFSIDAWYNLTGNAGTSQGITINLSGLSGAFFNINFFEVLPPAGSTASYDDSGSVIGTNCTTCTAVQLNNITATDIIIANPGGGSQADYKAWSSPYITDLNGGAYSINTNSGAAPTVVFTGPTNPIFMAMAFKSTAGVFSPPSYQNQNSIVQFKNTSSSILCNPLCSYALPQATGSGHLLFVMSADLQNTRINSITGGGTWVVPPTGSSGCYVNFFQNSNNQTMSCAYVLSSSAGTASINITMSGTAATGFAFWEIASTAGPFSLDAIGNTVNPATYPARGQPLTISGSNDVIFQGGEVPGGASGVSVYPQTYSLLGLGYVGTQNASEALLLNSGPGPTAPVPSWVNVNQVTGVFGAAFRTVGGPTLPSPPTGLTAVVH
jgi:hypothetical protein